MNSRALANICHEVDPAEWDDVLASYDRGPILPPVAPHADAEFVLNFPFPTHPDDVVLLGAYSESRSVDSRFFDFMPIQGGSIKAQLASGERRLKTPLTHDLRPR